MRGLAAADTLCMTVMLVCHPQTRLTVDHVVINRDAEVASRREQVVYHRRTGAVVELKLAVTEIMHSARLRCSTRKWR